MTNKIIKVAIVGAAGYTGEELIRLISGHPCLEIGCITSREYAGQHVASVFPRFSEWNLSFVEPNIDTIASSCELAFLCLPHGLAIEFAVPLSDKGVKIIDLSADFRLRDPEAYKHYYDLEHPASELLDTAVYGLPEKHRESIRSSSFVACPGCYPTSIILPVAPLLKAEVASPDDIIVCSMSGVSGAGKKVALPFLFSECRDSVRSYNIKAHRHIPEIEQELSDSSPHGTVGLTFIPHLIPINRGLHSTIILSPCRQNVTVDDIARIFHDHYGSEPFVRMLPCGSLADTKNVIYSNTCEIGFDFDPRTEKILLTSAIDNLTKGASGQAIQCLNIMYGLDEGTGLA